MSSSGSGGWPATAQWGESVTDAHAEGREGGELGCARAIPLGPRRRLAVRTSWGWGGASGHWPGAGSSVCLMQAAQQADRAPSVQRAARLGAPIPSLVSRHR